MPTSITALAWRGLYGSGHNARENPFAALAGDRLIHVRDIGVGVPWHVADPAAPQSQPPQRATAAADEYDVASVCA